MAEYNYEDWLNTHAKRKTIMEKLERSLVPFQLFSDIDLNVQEVGAEADVEYNGNVYRYLLLSKGLVNHRDVYLFRLSKLRVENEWEDILMGFTEFKVVTYQGKIVTIYPFQEHYFEQVIGMFEAEQYYDLYKMRTVYIKNLLARYVLLKLINIHKCNYALLYSVRQDGESIPVLAGDGENHWIMYAFSRKEANDLARYYHGRCSKLTVVYFINQNFECEDKNQNFYAQDVEVISIKRFYRNLGVSAAARVIIEKQVFFLIEMLYESRMEWDERKMMRKIMNAPKLTDKNIEMMDVPKMLVEDALNVLIEDYNNPKDIFHMLCAANLINTYTNRYNAANKKLKQNKGKYRRCGKRGEYSLNKRVSVMYTFKNVVMDSVINLLLMRSRHLKVALAHVFGSVDYTLLVNVRIEGRDYQFKFRGINQRYIDALHHLGVRDDGVYNMTRL